MKKKIIVFVILVLVVALAGYGYSIAKNSAKSKVENQKTIADLYESFELKNGMQVFVIPNNSVPAVSHMVWYRVGAKDELAGESGVTHLLEHLLFKGTEKFPKGVFSQAVSESGGQENAFTGQDYTAFYQNVPTEKLGLMMEMEADRMGNLEFSEAELLTERDVVMEEYRMRVTNNPRALMLRELDAALYRNHPYRKQVIGWAHEIMGLTKEDAFGYYRRYYDPKNAVLVVAGDVTPEKVLELAKKYYEVLPANFKVSPQLIFEPPRMSSAKIIYEDERVSQPELWQKFIAPSYTTKDAAELKTAFALEVLGRLLGGGTSSILYKSLVVEKGMASAIGSAYSGYNIGPSEFTVFAYPQADTSTDALEAEIGKEIAKVISGNVDESRLAAVKKAMIAEQIYDREGLQEMAYKIGQNHIIGLKPEFIDEWEAGVSDVSAADIIAAAKQVLQTDKAVVGVLKNKKVEEGEVGK